MAKNWEFCFGIRGNHYHIYFMRSDNLPRMVKPDENSISKREIVKLSFRIEIKIHLMFEG